jgi:hypothetical protein
MQAPLSNPSHAKQLLANALRERLVVIADRELYAREPAAHLEKLRSVSETIRQLQIELGASIDPQLAHYLERSSFDKALAYLEAEQAGG